MSKNFTATRMRLNAIDLIQDSATSPLVAGINPSIGSRYFGPGGEPWMKTGATDIAWAQTLLLSPYFNVKDYGATGDGVTNDRVAVQSAITAAIAAGGGVVFFPVGRYRCDVIAGVTPVFSLSGEANGKLVFMGCGRASSIFFGGNGQTTDKYLFQITAGCKYVGFRNLELHSELTNEFPQQHLIQFINTTQPETGRSFIIDCYFGHTRGDAIRFLGTTTTRIQNVLMKRLVFQMESSPSSRTCISYQRNTDFTTVDACYCDGAGPIDFEPTGTGSLIGHRIHRNFFAGSVTLSGAGSDLLHERSVFAHNTNIMGVSQAGEGSVTGGDVQKLDVVGNIVDIQFPAPTAGSAIAFEFSERAQDILVADNLAFISNNTSVGVVYGIEPHAVGENSDCTFAGNIAVNTSNPTDGGAYSFRDVVRGVMFGNQGYLTLSANNGFLYRIESLADPISDCVAGGGMALGVTSRLENGVVTGSTDIGNFCASDNLVRNVNRGVRISSSNDQRQAARNVFPQAAVGAVVLNAPLVSCPIDGVGSTIAPCTMMLTAAPEGVVAAGIGTIGLRSTGGGAGSTLYVKESNNGGTTGWAAK